MAWFQSSRSPSTSLICSALQTGLVKQSTNQSVVRSLWVHPPVHLGLWPCDSQLTLHVGCVQLLGCCEVMSSCFNQGRVITMARQMLLLHWHHVNIMVIGLKWLHIFICVYICMGIYVYFPYHIYIYIALYVCKYLEWTLNTWTLLYYFTLLFTILFISLSLSLVSIHAILLFLLCTEHRD